MKKSITSIVGALSLSALSMTVGCKGDDKKPEGEQKATGSGEKSCSGKEGEKACSGKTGEKSCSGKSGEKSCSGAGH